MVTGHVSTDHGKHKTKAVASDLILACVNVHLCALKKRERESWPTGISQRNVAASRGPKCSRRRVSRTEFNVNITI